MLLKSKLSILFAIVAPDWFQGFFSEIDKPLDFDENMSSNIVLIVVY